MPEPPLYPEIEPYRSGSLPVSALHTLSFEECGNPQGIPIVFLHGGPGGGCTERDRRFFDPAAYRVVLFDQRGCGRSTPFAELAENTTWDLVADVERLRAHLGIERWLVFGGSWGSTLALAYGEAHPERALGLVLRGVFTLRDWESEWLHGGGLAHLRPQEWERFLAPIPEDERGDLVSAYDRRLTGPDSDVQLACAAAWVTWESSLATLLPDAKRAAEQGAERSGLAAARLGAHYLIHRGWLEAEDALLRGVARIAHLPAKIVHGRYDLVCPPRAALDLHRAWPGSELTLVADGGHSASEPSMAAALVAATDAFARRLAGEGELGQTWEVQLEGAQAPPEPE